VSILGAAMYCRVYINIQGTACEGLCPKCGKKVAFQTGPAALTTGFLTHGDGHIVCCSNSPF
jgi:hypothetical protein